MTVVAAPGGNGTTADCTTTILSTLPAGAYGCIKGTSMASPHAAGVAALIASQHGRLGSDGDVKLSPTKVKSLLQGTAIDIGLPGYDDCFSNGRSRRSLAREVIARYRAQGVDNPVPRVRGMATT
ncbi:MAG: S8 family serine peptidase [Candidatus Limnocylindria bacterium]